MKLEKDKNEDFEDIDEEIDEIGMFYDEERIINDFKV